MATVEVQIPDHGQMRSEIQGFVSQKDALTQHTMAIRVTNEIERLAASDWLASTLIPLYKTIDGKRQTYSLALRRIATQWDGEFSPALEAIKGLIAYVKQALIDYQAEQERIQREAQVELDRQAEEDRKALEASGQVPQIPEDIVALAPQPEKTVHTAGGSSTVKKVPVVVITNEALIPRKYLCIDHKLLDPDVKAGIQVPGAKLDFRSELAVRAR